MVRFALFDWLDESGRGLAQGYEERLEMLEYAAWLELNAATLEPPVELFDTTERSIEETAAAVCGWLTARG